MVAPSLWFTLQYRFAKVPPYSSCADKQYSVYADCAELKICVNGNTRWISITQSLFRESFIVVVGSFEDVIVFLNAGVCNVISGETGFVMHDQGFTGP